MSKLTIITEGGLSKAGYFVNNGVFPHVWGFSVESFIPRIKYLTEEDDILVVVNGFTDFKPSEIYSLFMMLERQYDYWDESGMEGRPNIVVVSNIKLGAVNFPYYYYKGDLFYGQVWSVSGGRLTEVQVDVDSSGKRKRAKQNNASADSFSLNGLMAGYKKYNQAAINATTLGDPFSGTESPKEDNREYADAMALSDAIIRVDRFKK